MMKLFVKFYTSPDYHVVPFTEGDETVSCLLKEIAKRISDVDPSSYCLRLVCAGGGAVLCPSDKVRDVLNDGDYVTVGKFNISGASGCTNIMYVHLLTTINFTTLILVGPEHVTSVHDHHPTCDEVYPYNVYLT